MRTQAMILIFLLFGYTSAIPGMSTAGTDFVFSLPKYKPRLIRPLGDNAIEIFTDTEEDVALTRITYPRTLTLTDRTRMVKIFPLKKYILHKTQLPKNLLLVTTGIFPAIYINASAPIRVVALARNEPDTAAEATRIIPVQSCHYSYYITAPVGYPFMSVISLSSKTNVKITFPNYKLTFKKDCKADKKCAPNQIVTVELDPYQVWHFTIDNETADFQNTMITSDFPVNVIAGSVRCRSPPLNNTDMCFSSMKATVTWGKVYIVPEFNEIVKDKGLRINAKKFPFQLTIEGHSDSTKHTVKSHVELYVYSRTEKTVVVHAARPFGLYFLMPCLATRALLYLDCSMISIIPVEQWMDGLRYIPDKKDDYDGNVSSILISSHGKNDDVTLSDLKMNLSWTEAVNYRGTLFNYAAIDIRKVSTSIFTVVADKRMILYLAGTKSYSYFAFPYDFYHGEIYQDNCIRKQAVFSDGIDNDCDGKIDEEALNGKDDDNDNLIDEDYVEKYEDGKWAEWFEMCSIPMCRKTNVTQTKKVRSCSEPRPSRFGKLCKGNSTKCEPDNTCECKKQEWTCTCNPGCANELCDKHQATCTRCKDGYFSSAYCLVKCPNGYKGPGCSHSLGYDASNGDSNNSSKASDDDVSRSRVLFIIIMSALLVLIQIGLILMCFLVRRRRAQKEHKKETKEDVVEEQHAEDVAEEVAEEAGDASGEEEGAEQEDEGLEEDHEE